jgi:hypothetical protein
VSDRFALPFDGLVDTLKLLKSNQQRIHEVVETRRQVRAVEGTSCTAWLSHDCLVDVLHLPKPLKSNQQRIPELVEIHK